MEITKLSSEGQVLIPKALRDAYHWEAGQELIAIDTGDGILLKPKKPFQKTTIEQVLGCLQYHGTPRSIEDMEAAIRKGVQEQWHGHS
jgi:AbrB family looped-hinge helix DNA binding protein